MTVKTLDDLFHETLKDLYYAEKKLVRTLPGMVKKAASPPLKEAIHRTEIKFPFLGFNCLPSNRQQHSIKVHRGKVRPNGLHEFDTG